MLRVLTSFAWGMLTIGGVLSTLGTLSPWLAIWFADRYWLCEVATHFQVQYIAALCVIGLLFAFARRWKQAAVWLVIAAVAFCYMVLPLYIPVRPRPQQPRSLRVLSSNIAWFNPHHHPILKLIKDEDPDVVLLYEVNPDWLEDLKPLEERYPHFRVAPSPGHSGTALYSRLPVNEISYTSVAGSPLMYTTVQVGEQLLTIVGAHPTAPNNISETKRRNNQLSDLANLILSLPRPRILIGDLNTSSWNPVFKRLLMETALRDSRRGFGIQPSWPVDFPLFRTTIDHCLVSKDIGVIDRRVGRSVGSDHFPVIVDLVVPEDEQ